MAYELKPKSHYRAGFDGSDALFDHCWRMYRAALAGAIDNPEDDSDVQGWLEAFASEAVNNSRSRFYIYG